MVFHALTFARSRGRCWKPRPKAAVFNTSQGTWRMLMHWITMFDRYYYIKTENICYISCYFLHFSPMPFHRCLANEISTDYARSRAGQYTFVTAAILWPRYRLNESLHSRALTAWIALLIHSFSPVNSRLLITCGTAFYAITGFNWFEWYVLYRTISKCITKVVIKVWLLLALLSFLADVKSRN